MFEGMVERLRNNADHYMTVEGAAGLVHLLTDAADAFEELIEVIQNHNFLESLIKSHWVPVTETNKPKAYEPVMVVYIGWNDALPHRDCTAYWSEDEEVWKWAETNDKVKVPITHYMPLPPLPELSKEVTQKDGGIE